MFTLTKEPNIVGRRNAWFTFSSVIIGIGLLSMGLNWIQLGRPLNLGIDFTGGTTVSLRFKNIHELLGRSHNPAMRANFISRVRNVCETHKQGGSVIQVTDNLDVYIRMKPLDNAARVQILDEMKYEIGDYDLLEVDTIGPSIGSELRTQSFWILLFALGGMMIYITYRFEFGFAVAAILALIHDGLITLGFASLFRIEIDTAFVAAMLTILGYSINDTIVIFDRIRENIHLLREKNLTKLINTSVFQTFGRSINTTLTTLLVVGSLFVLGGTTIKGFSAVLFVGIAAGAYSSIFIASPLLIYLKQSD